MKTKWSLVNVWGCRDWDRRVSAKRNAVSFRVMEKVWIIHWWCLHNFINVLKTTELYTLKQWFLCNLYLNQNKIQTSSPAHNLPKIAVNSHFEKYIWKDVCFSIISQTSDLLHMLNLVTHPHHQDLIASTLPTILNHLKESKNFLIIFVFVSKCLFSMLQKNY